MPRVSDEHRAAQRDRIQQAAMRLVRTKGLAALTMGDIIKESGLSAGAIYGYYKGKDELVLDVAANVLLAKKELLATLGERRPVPAPAHAVAELLRSVPPDWLAGGMMLQFWGAATTSGSVMQQARDFATTMGSAVTDYLVAWFEDGGVAAAPARERAALLAPVVMSFAQGYILQRSLGHDVDVETFVAGIEALMGGELAGRGR